MLSYVTRIAILEALSRCKLIVCFKVNQSTYPKPPMLVTRFRYSFKLKSFHILLRTMSSPSVFITRPDIPKVALDIFKDKGYEVTTWNETRPVPRNELLKGIKNKNALFCMLTDKVDAEILDSAGPSLKVIATMSVGYEHLDLNEIKKRNISIGYTPGVLTDAVAELTLGLLLATSRRFFESHEAIVQDKWSAWSPLWMCGPTLTGKVIGVVGFGRIGQEFARRLIPFKVKSIIYYGRSEKKEGKELGAKLVSFDELLRESDFIIVTCALTPETKGMFNKSAFEKMKKSAIFVNTSRGAVVDQDALIEALKNKTIRAAGLDVMTPEPISPDHPLLKLDNCVVIPHLGSATEEARQEMAKLTANNIIAGLENKPLPAGL